MSNMSQ
jgi:hypothetical protein